VYIKPIVSLNILERKEGDTMVHNLMKQVVRMQKEEVNQQDMDGLV
jgi:signal transduction histidine kinase